MIFAYHLEKFCKQQAEPDPSVVHEFYANLWLNNVYSLFVREQQIPLSLRAINQLFDLHNYNDDTDDYFSLFSNLSDEVCNKLLQEVTVPGTQWSCSK